MTISILEPPATTLLTTLGTVKAELSITDASLDDVLNGIIARASSTIVKECGWPFGVATYLETLKGSNTQYLGLGRIPLVLVTEVVEDSEVITDWVVEDQEAAVLFRQIGFGRTTGLRAWGLESYTSQYVLAGNPSALRYAVTYRAGYVLPPIVDPFALYGTDDVQPLPGAVEQACLDTVKSWFYSMDLDRNVAQAQVDNVKVQYAQDAQNSTRSIPDYAWAKLKDYRRANR